MGFNCLLLGLLICYVLAVAWLFVWFGFDYLVLFGTYIVWLVIFRNVLLGLMV